MLFSTSLLKLDIPVLIQDKDIFLGDAAAYVNIVAEAPDPQLELQFDAGVRSTTGRRTHAHAEAARAMAIAFKYFTISRMSHLAGEKNSLLIRFDGRAFTGDLGHDISEQNKSCAPEPDDHERSARHALLDAILAGDTIRLGITSHSNEPREDCASQTVRVDTISTIIMKLNPRIGAS